MVVGAGWAGARSMTSTSGPGISLMSEFVGLAYFSEIPVVIWDIQRVGPSTGPPDPYSPGRHPEHLLPFSWRYEAHSAVSVLGFGVLRVRWHVVRPRRALPDTRLRHVRPGPRHEYLDVGRVSLSGQAHRSRQGIDRRGARQGRVLRALSRRGRRRHSLPKPFQGLRTHARLISTAEAATTRTRSTASAPTSTRTP